MDSHEAIKLSRDIEAVEIPAGYVVSLPAGTEAYITQALGGTYTIRVPHLGGLYRVAGRDADAIGKPVADEKKSDDTELSGPALEERVWEALKTCYDPEIPVNIVDLGLIYGMNISTVEPTGSRVDVQMTLTAQGCGMGASIAYDAKTKIMEIPGVRDADVQVVWEPAWTADKISAEGRLILGIR